jgi:SAM-dependent methyltransferase
VSDNEQELGEIRARYERRQSIHPQQYGRMQLDVLLRVQDRQRHLVRLLSSRGIKTLHNLDILEIGCGTGANLLEFIEFGADPDRLVGNELLPDRLALARRTLPSCVRLIGGDAAQLPLEAETFDIVYQSTVFSSILSGALQVGVAQAMWRLLRPGGAVLWYDFTFDNPRNPDVRGVKFERICELFPLAKIFRRRVTLAPPLARRLARLHPLLCSGAGVFPFLRTHLLCWIEKS